MIGFPKRRAALLSCRRQQSDIGPSCRLATRKVETQTNCTFFEKGSRLTLSVGYLTVRSFQAKPANTGQRICEIGQRSTREVGPLFHDTSRTDGARHMRFQVGERPEWKPKPKAT